MVTGIPKGVYTSACPVLLHKWLNITTNEDYWNYINGEILCNGFPITRWTI